MPNLPADVKCIGFEPIEDYNQTARAYVYQRILPLYNTVLQLISTGKKRKADIDNHLNNHLKTLQQFFNNQVIEATDSNTKIQAILLYQASVAFMNDRQQLGSYKAVIDTYKELEKVNDVTLLLLQQMFDGKKVDLSKFNILSPEFKQNLLLRNNELDITIKENCDLENPCVVSAGTSHLRRYYYKAKESGEIYKYDLSELPPESTFISSIMPLRDALYENKDKIPFVFLAPDKPKP